MHDHVASESLKQNRTRSHSKQSITCCAGSDESIGILYSKSPALLSDLPFNWTNISLYIASNLWLCAPRCSLFAKGVKQFSIKITWLYMPQPSHFLFCLERTITFFSLVSLSYKLGRSSLILTRLIPLPFHL